jgi:hypothetical protein
MVGAGTRLVPGERWRMATMVERTNVETGYNNCGISVVTEAMEGGRWGVAVRITHRAGDAERIIPVELPPRRFDSEDAARSYGVEAARRFIDDNMPRT